MVLKDIYMRDPFIFVEDGVAYLIGTTDKNAWEGKAKGFLGYKSEDLVNFTGPYVLFVNDGSFWSDENYWAPEMYKIDGKYHIFASFFKQGKLRRSQVLTCDSPLGLYKPTSKPFTPEGWQCLDATFYEENGKRYSFFCHEWVQIHDGEICVGELNHDLTELSNIKVLFKASDAKWPVCFYCGGSDIKNYVTDGPFIYKTSKGRLIMLWSSNSSKGYAIGMAYSDDGVYGDWKQVDEPLFANEGGHGMIFEFKGKKYLIIHTDNSSSTHERPLIKEIIEENNLIRFKEM